MPVSTPQQVWASVDGSTKLSNIVQISGGGSGYANFCAVDASGGVWCWGYGGNGQLGTGDTSNGPYARPVLTNLTTSFTSAAEVQVGYEATCARKTNGTIWCWGQNGAAELGVPQSQVQNSYYATQQISIMSDTSVLCWGYNAYGAAGAPTAGNSTVGPTTVLLGMGMGPLTGVIDVATSNYYTMCAKVATTNTPVFCWGNYSSSPYPAPFKDNQQNPVTGITSPLYGNYQVSLSYVDLNGKVSNAGAPSSWQPSCAGLLSPLADGGP
jgi:alpha-tubulin suppressor-like RCC1 family protein